MSRRFLSIGECMVELSQAGDGLLRKGFAYDTFNTAWYARACLAADWSVDYFTALGDDAMSDEMLAFIDTSGIGTSLIRRIRGRTPGLYMINLKDGERSFSYWRDSSAARSLAADPDRLREAVESAAVIYFSGITLAILPHEDAETLLAEVRRAKAMRQARRLRSEHPAAPLVELRRDAHDNQRRRPLIRARHAELRRRGGPFRR